MSSDNTSNNKENTSPMTKEDAARIQAAEAKKSDTGETAAGSFAARAQSTADKNDKDKKPAAADSAGGGTSPSSGNQKERPWSNDEGGTSPPANTTARTRLC